ncbi:MAG TPA: hypothetical protein VF234_05480, partial [Limnochordia bacterium]
ARKRGKGTIPMVWENDGGVAAFGAIRFAEIVFDQAAWRCELLPNGCVRYCGPPMAGLTVRPAGADASAVRTFILLSPPRPLLVCGDVLHIPRPVLALGQPAARSGSVVLLE